MAATAKRGWIGVDVGTRAIKLAQVEQAADRLRLVDAVVVPRTRSGAVQPIAEGTAACCLEEIRAALSAGKGFLGRTAACTMSMYWCQTKPLRITAGTAAADRSVIASELSVLGCAEEDDFDFWETGTVQGASESQTQNVIALTIPRCGTAQVGGDLYRCGLDCRVLDALPLALARAVRMTSTSDGPQPLAAVDWGFAEATFCAISGQTPTFVRRLRGCGFGSVLQQVCSELGLHLDEVEALLTDSHSARAEDGHGARRELQAAIAELAPQPLRTMVEELQRTLTYLETQPAAALPERVWLFGAGAVWKLAGEFLASKINCPVEIWRLQDAGIEKTAAGSFPEEVLAPAITLSALAWASQ